MTQTHHPPNEFPLEHDPVVLNDWHPVAIAAGIAPGKMAATTLLGLGIVLWRDQGGTLHAWEDRCPHRGMKLSMGTLQADTLTCPYHGWQFGAQGRCRHIPALPELQEGHLRAQAKVLAVKQAYGLAWVCAGSPQQDVPPFPEFDDERLRKVWCGPYDVQSSAPRIIENFLDMAHFAFVHEGILGDRAMAAIRDYRIEEFNDPRFGSGVRATGCHAWQPRSNALADGGSEVEYTYRVVRPFTAILTKEPAAQQGFREAISLHLQPLTETSTRAWIILAMTNDESTDDEMRAFQDTIFLQDRPIVENQHPLKLPLATDAEASVACDRMSLAYRKYLRTLGLRYGVTGVA